MNRSHIEHTIVAVWLQCIPGFLWNDWVTGAVLAAGIFWSREHAQAEYKWIQANGGVRANTKWPEFGALQPKLWSTDSILDFVAPALCVVLMAIAASVRWGL